MNEEAGILSNSKRSPSEENPISSDVTESSSPMEKSKSIIALEAPPIWKVSSPAAAAAVASACATVAGLICGVTFMTGTG